MFIKPLNITTTIPMNVPSCFTAETCLVMIASSPLACQNHHSNSFKILTLFKFSIESTSEGAGNEPDLIRSSRAQWFIIPVSLIALIIPDYSTLGAYQKTSSPSVQYLKPLKFHKASDFVGGFAGVKIGKKWGFINSSGKVAVPFSYDVIYDFSDGMAEVKPIKR